MGHYMDDVEDLCRKCDAVGHRDGLCVAHWHFHFFGRQIAEAVRDAAIQRCDRGGPTIGTAAMRSRIRTLDLDAIIASLEGEDDAPKGL